MEEGELILGWGNFILSNGMVIYINFWYSYIFCVVWGEKEKRFFVEWCGFFCFLFSDLEVLFDFNGMEWWGFSRLGFRAILMYIYVSILILLLNLIIYFEIENFFYFCYLIRYIEFYFFMIYFFFGCLFLGFLY